MEEGIFYLEKGWTFQRTESGGVLIKKHANDNPDDPEVVEQIEMDDSGWASVVSSVSAKGEEDGRFYTALNFHRGED